MFRGWFRVAALVIVTTTAIPATEGGAPPPATKACVPERVQGIPPPAGSDPINVAIRGQRAWYNKIRRCRAEERAAAKPSLPAAGGDGQRVTLEGYLVAGSTETPAVLSRDPRNPRCIAAGWQWDLVLCGGERLEIHQPGQGPLAFMGSSCVREALSSHRSNIVVSGKLETSRLTRGRMIVGAHLCRP